MLDGYLIIETHGEHPGLARMRTAEVPPETPEPGARAGPQVRYVARFADLSAAQMQVHARLRLRLVDVETGLYRTDAIAAIAAAESLALRHLQVYLDPELVDNPSLAEAIAIHRWRHRLADRIWQSVGAAAVVLLLLKLLFGF